MVVSCVAPICPNHFTPRRNVSYFHFPNPLKYPQLHNAWLQAIAEQDFKPTKNSYVCELHFNEDDFNETYIMKKKFMPSEYFRPILKPDAVPKMHTQGCESSKSDGSEKLKILSELLGESYLNWKYKMPEKVFEKEGKENNGQNCIKHNFVETEVKNEIKEEMESTLCVVKTCVLPLSTKLGVKTKEDSVNKNKLFDITKDYILKKPLKPLPEALQRIIPSILKVIIKEAPDHKKNKHSKLSTTLEQFSCTTKLLNNYFYLCKFCKLTSFLKVSLAQHIKITHLPIDKVDGVLRRPMKIYKIKEPKCYWCEPCDYRTFSQFLFVKHALEKKEHQLLEQMEVKWFSCEYCIYRCRKSESLRRHLVNKHNYKKLRNKV